MNIGNHWDDETIILHVINHRYVFNYPYVAYKGKCPIGWVEEVW